MALVTRVYFNAVFGALGGLLGWMLFSVFGEESTSVARFLRDGAFVGGAIGYFVVSVEAIRDRSWPRFVRLATVGVILGAVGGAIGMVVAEQVNFNLVSRWGAIRGSTSLFLLAVATRGLGFVALGLAVGGSEGIAARSMGKFSYGLIGGALGGFVGGCLFGVVYELNKAEGFAAFPGAAGLIIMGACIGSLTAFVQGVFQPASVKVMRGWQEGREYPLDKDATLLGREEHADIALFRDMKVEKQHAFIQRRGSRYILVNNGAPPEWTRVNDQPVPQAADLHDGDRVQLGNILLRFQMRAARNRPRPGRAEMPHVIINS
jgi:hypothetical protein